MPTPTPTTGPGFCTRCLQAVLWTLTAANRVPMAVSRESDPRGNQAVYQDATGRWRSRQLDAHRPVPEHNEQLHMPHVATCPSPAPRRTLPRSRPGRRRPVVPYGRWQR